MANATYLNFDLLLYSARDGYVARVLNPTAGDASASFTLPFSAGQLATWTTGNSQPFRNLKPTGERDEQPQLDAQSFGEQLYQAVFGSDLELELIRSFDAARRDGKGLRVRLYFASDATELASLPWEYLYSPTWGHFLALSEQTPLVRYVDVAHASQMLDMAPPLHILAMLSDPVDVQSLQVEHEWELLQKALGGVDSLHQITLERLPEATFEALQARLQGEPVHVFHFIGHGYFDGAGSGGGLVLENQSRQAQLTDAARIGALLHDHASLRLAFLNACEGAKGRPDHVFAGVAQRLVQQEVPGVVAMQFPISDGAALTLAQSFYTSLATGAAVDTALTIARKAVFGTTSGREWGTPVFFSRSPDNRLILMPQGDARPTIELQHGEPESVVVPAGPFWMGSDDASAAERPRHQVELLAFRIGRYLVTNCQYALYVRECGVAVAPEMGFTLAAFGHALPPGREEHPVVGVSWEEARSYCAWLSQRTDRRYRLPTEAEWEKATRGDDGRRFPWGDQWEEGRCNVDGSGTSAVGAFPSGASPYGCHDMLGNVQEWTQSIWGRTATPEFWYPYRPKDGRESLAPAQTTYREFRICRGGSYRSQLTRLATFTRARAEADIRHITRGFRVLMELTA